jgi:integrase
VPGSGEWWIRYVDAQGRYRREKAGTWGSADKLLTKRKGEALEGKKLPELRKRTVVFGELADDAVKYVEGRYARPADDIARMKLLKECFPSRTADGITAGEIQNTLDALTVKNKWSPSSRNHYHNLLSLAYRLGILHGKVKESPLRGLRRETENNSRVRFLTPEEEKKLRDAIRSKPEWAEHEPEFDLALHTGLRRGSMYLDLTWENVDLKNRIAMIPRTKNGERVVVPLNADAMRALANFRSRGDGTGRVVRNLAGETLSVNAHWFVPAVRQAGITNFRWHDLRHTYASRLRQAGVPLGNIAELLGHKGLAMSRRYAHLSISNLHEAVSRIANGTPVAPEPVRQGRGDGYIN